MVTLERERWREMLRGEEDGGFRGRVGRDGEFRSRGQVRVLVDAESFPVVAGIATAMER